MTNTLLNNRILIEIFLNFMTLFLNLKTSKMAKSYLFLMILMIIEEKAKQNY